LFHRAEAEVEAVCDGGRGLTIGQTPAGGFDDLSGCEGV